jgi:hypothetical protein
MRMRGKRSALLAFAGATFVLAQVAGCGSCVKDDPQPSVTVNGKERKPIDLKAADKRLTPFTVREAGAADAATD